LTATRPAVAAYLLVCHIDARYNQPQPSTSSKLTSLQSMLQLQ
jgi:hypothetical protein